MISKSLPAYQEGYTAGERAGRLSRQDEIQRLRKAIQDYLDGNWGTRLPSKNDKCPHGKFGWDDCGNCIDDYFAGVLNPPAEGKSP